MHFAYSLPQRLAGAAYLQDAQARLGSAICPAIVENYTKLFADYSNENWSNYADGDIVAHLKRRLEPTEVYFILFIFCT